MPIPPDGFIKSREIVYNPTEAVLVDVSSVDQTFLPPLRALSIGVAGDVKVDMPNASAIVIPGAALAVGIQHSCVITKIYNSGTVATSMVGWR